MLYTVDFDTGSSDLFVPSTKCGTSCSGHKAYNPSASSTSHDLRTKFTLTYLDGASISGEQYNDVVTIGGVVVRGAMFFVFLLPNAHTSHHRRRARDLALHPTILVLTSRQMA